jgi:hypothetical protein
MTMTIEMKRAKAAERQRKARAAKAAEGTLSQVRLTAADRDLIRVIAEFGLKIDPNAPGMVEAVLKAGLESLKETIQETHVVCAHCGSIVERTGGKDQRFCVGASCRTVAWKMARRAERKEG